MAITLDGNNGITSPDFEPSSSTTPTNGLFLPATNALGFATNSTERLRLDASGNLGIGTSSPSGKLDVRGNVVNGAGTGNFLLQNSASNAASPTFSFNNYSDTGMFAPTTSTLAWSTGGSERARIDSSGNLLVGKSAPDNSERLGVKSSGSTSSTYAVRVDNSAATAIFMIRDDGYLRSPTTYNLTSGTANVSIDANGFFTRATSSLRYKKDIVDYDKGLEIVNQLRPVYYKSSVAGADGTIPDTQFAGMIAEEVDALGLSEFVEYGPDGEVESIRYGNMVSLAFKAIQELTARLEALENK